jgi:hypothetical protein
MSENIDFVQRIVTWIEDKQIFSRERKSNEQRALGMLLYDAGLSYEKAGSFANASHEPVREWYQKCRDYHMHLITGRCPMMYLGHGISIHTMHREIASQRYDQYSDSIFELRRDMTSSSYSLILK